MSLRARLLLGAVLIALVLGGRGRRHRAHAPASNLVDQVDAQLRSANERFGAGFGPGGPGGSPGRPAGRAAGAERALHRAARPPTASSRRCEPRTSAATTLPLPVVDDGDVAALQSGPARSPSSSTDPDVDYRMRAQRQRPGGARVVLALPLDDVHESVRQLRARGARRRPRGARRCSAS